jgi:photosystem II stability/assembly factor-like uncharacterized protein
MKLIASGVGWAASGQRLYWTTNGGGEWADVTPKPASAEEIACVFFLDTSRGWALLSSPDKESDVKRFDLAFTSNSGESWLIRPVVIPDLDAKSMTLTGDGRVDFPDALHGWLNLGLVGGAAFHPGLLLATTDGGKTWGRAPGGSGTAGDIRFVTSEKGWVTSGDEIYVTRDGAKSWQQFSLQAPVQVYPAAYPTYDLPVFVDSDHGFLPVTYSGTKGSNSALVLFATIDGGATWKTDRILSGLKEGSLGQLAPSAIADSVLVAAETSNHTHLKLKTLPPGQKITESNAEVLSADSGVLQISFGNAATGWALVADAHFRATKLLRTSDSGATWYDITPPVRADNSAPHGASKESPRVIIRPRARPHAAAVATYPGTANPWLIPPGTPVHISTGLGFDQQFVGVLPIWALGGTIAFWLMSDFMPTEARATRTTRT